MKFKSRVCRFLNTTILGHLWGWALGSPEVTQMPKFLTGSGAVFAHNLCTPPYKSSKFLTVLHAI